MEFNEVTTAVAFVAVIAIGVGGMIASDMMVTETILMMVAPSMVVFGAIMLALGVKFGEYRATN
ncbi:DUF7333 family protein [Natronorubrum tibetense]|uniref:Uncharacterized protein n=1 Tax=Natronorubrum tibetense GA33 TaxID=1114856 RepID=L9W952_9EURY|nr:hypothetical protein [Natronorubrum tibetense]ELY45990.1 hypothetical protein C496_01870 [Natronorubrum tibetense GA33]